MLGLGYSLIGVVLVVQEVSGPLSLSWCTVPPGLLILIGLLIGGTTIVGSRRSVHADTIWSPAARSGDRRGLPTDPPG